MSRLESDPVPNFKLTKEDTKNPGLFAKPLSLRRQAIEEFDAEFRLENEKKFDQTPSTQYKLLGDQLYDMNCNEDAMAAYLRALTYEHIEIKEHFEILKNCGNILLRLGDTNAAEEYYNKAYTIFPDSDVLLVNFGSLALFRGEYDKALERFREAVGINDKNDKAWVGLAMIHREYGDSELAWANAEKALDINPSNESATKLVADWALKDNEIEKAIFRLEKYLALITSDATIYMWLAKFYYFSGQLDLAAKNSEMALRLDPEVEGGRDVLTVIKSERIVRGAKI